MSAFFSNYHGRCTGRLMHFLFSYHIDFDYCTIGDKEVYMFGKLVASYTWDEDTDVPTFVFYDRFEFLNSDQERRKQNILQEDEKVGNHIVRGFH